MKYKQDWKSPSHRFPTQDLQKHEQGTGPRNKKNIVLELGGAMISTYLEPQVATFFQPLYPLVAHNVATVAGKQGQLRILVRKAHEKNTCLRPSRIPSDRSPPPSA